MSVIHLLASQPWVPRLGWTLVHFLWQGLAIAILYAAARRGFSRISTPNTRYVLACAALAAMAAAPLMTWELLHPAQTIPDVAYRIQSDPPTATATTVATPALAPRKSIRDLATTATSPQFLPFIVIAWLAGVMIFWIRLAGGWMLTARMRSTHIRPAPPEWQHTLSQLGMRIAISRPVRLLISALVEVPTVVGCLRPVVLVPVGALTGLPPEHLEALLLHELAHIRRHDYLVNILQSIVEALLFYHPAVWWVSSHIRAEREFCCDDIAASLSGDAFTYASALVKLEVCRPAHDTPALAANGGSLSQRIARLLGQPQPHCRTAWGPSVLAVAMLLLAVGYGLFAQSDPHPAFEVASVKPNPANWVEPTHHPMGVGYRPGGRLTATNASLQLLIQFAYASHDSPHWQPLLASRVIGGPTWVATPGYDIEAKPAGNTEPKQTWLMLQTLLADRFKLALHRETRELPIYELTVAKSGAKLPSPKDVSCISFPPGTPPRPVRGKVDCGHVFGPFNSTGALGLGMRGSKVHMPDFAQALALPLDRPVLDKTGFTGEFDLDIIFNPDGALLGMPGYGEPGDPSVPNLFATLEQRLGLKLVPAKGPVEVLVIDHAEKPTAN